MSSNNYVQFRENIKLKILFILVLLSSTILIVGQAPNISYSSPQSFTIGVPITPLTPSNTGGEPYKMYNVSTFAGNGTSGALNGTGSAARFYNPNGIAFDASGNSYIADAGNHLIRKITPDGTASTFAGSGVAGSADGTGIAASFNTPTGIALDAAGNLFVADQGNHKIRKITPAGIVTTFAGSGSAGYVNATGIAASFNEPTGICIDPMGILYVTDRGGNRIRKIDTGAVVSNYSGSGTAGLYNTTSSYAARYRSPTGIAIDIEGNLYVADQGNHVIRKVIAGRPCVLGGTGVSNPTSGSGTLGYSDGKPGMLNSPYGVAVDSAFNVYVTDAENNRIRKIDAFGNVTTIAGNSTAGYSDALGTASLFNKPTGIALTSSAISVADNNSIRRICKIGFTIDKALPEGLSFNEISGEISGTPLLGFPPTSYIIKASNASGYSQTTLSISSSCLPPDISYPASGSFTLNCPIDTISPTNIGGSIPPHVVKAIERVFSYSTSGGIGIDSLGNIFHHSGNNMIRRQSNNGAESVFVSWPGGDIGRKVFDSAGNIYEAGVYGLWKITKTGISTILAGINLYIGDVDGTGSAARFNGAYGIVVDNQGNFFVTDRGNHKIKKITPLGVVTTFAGNGTAGSNDGQGTAASFNLPTSIVIDAQNNFLVRDQGNNKIRKISSSGLVSTLYSSDYSFDVMDEFGYFYGPASNSDIKGLIKIGPTGVSHILAGNDLSGVQDGIGIDAKFTNPSSVAFDRYGNLFMTDNTSGEILKISNVKYGYTISPALPKGLVINTNTGKISGIPTATSPATSYKIIARNYGGVDSVTITLSVSCNAPNISIASPLVLTKGVSVGTILSTNTGGSIPPSGTTTTFYRGSAFGICLNSSNNIIATEGNKIIQIDQSGTSTVIAGSNTSGSSDGIGAAASFSSPRHITIDKNGVMYVADYANYKVRKVSPAGVVTTLAGSGSAGSNDGVGSAASFGYLRGIAVDTLGNVYVGDYDNLKVRKIAPDGTVTTFASSINATGLKLDSSGNLYVATYTNNSIVKITPAGVATTIVNSGLNYPEDVALDGLGNLYIANYIGNCITKVSSGNVVSTLVGSGLVGNRDGVGTAANIYHPWNLVVDSYKNIYLTTIGNYTILKISDNNYSPTITPSLPAGLIYNPNKGEITGTPTALSPSTTYSITAKNACGSSTATFNLSVMNPTNYFINSGNWSDIGNWQNSKIPSTSDDIVIKANVEIDGNYSCENLTIEPEGFISISASTAGTKTNSLVVKQTLINKAGKGGICIRSEGGKANGSLIFKNDISKPVEASVEMFSIAANKRWQYIGVPLISMPYSPAFDNSVVFKLNENDSPAHWQLQGEGDVLNPFAGYAVTQEVPNTIKFQGTLFNRDTTLTLPLTSGASYQGVHMVGNPYTASIDIKKLSFGSNLTPSTYLYNTGSYADWNNSSGYGSSAGQYLAVPQNNAGVSELPSFIPSMQAFMVVASANGTGAANKLTIPYSAVQRNDSLVKNMQRTKALEQIFTMIEVKGKNLMDKMWIITEPNCSHGWDSGWDGEKIFGSPASPQIFARETSGDYQVTTVDDINNTSLGFMAGTDSIYTLKFTHEKQDSHYPNLYLIDLILNQTIDITKSGSTYVFNASNNNEATIRFRIATNTDSNTRIENSNKSIKLFYSDQKIIIDNRENTNGSLELYDISGRIVLKRNFNPNTITSIPVNFPAGVYLIEAQISHQTIKRSIIIPQNRL